MKLQRGIGLFQLLLVLVGLALIAILGFKLVPVYSEYYSLKHTLALVAKEQNGMSIPVIVESFQKHAEIDSIKSVKPEDLDIDSNASGTVIRVEYDREVPLVANISLKFAFKAEGRSGSSQ